MTTPPTTLHDRLRAELDRRLAVAKAATPGPWETGGIGDYGWSVHFPHHDGWANMGVETEDNEQGKADAEHIALHDPADAIRRYEGELEVLERHELAYLDTSDEAWQRSPYCGWCSQGLLWPCPDLKSLAGRLGVNVVGTP